MRKRLSILLAAIMMLAMTLASAAMATAEPGKGKGGAKARVVETLPTRIMATTTLMAAVSSTTPTSARPAPRASKPS